MKINNITLECGSKIDEQDEIIQLNGILEKCYQLAEHESKKENLDELLTDIDENEANVIIDLANTKHAARGVALTLGVCKILRPKQDIRNHKAEYDNGFSARGFDKNVTVPFLQKHGLPYNVESHWLSQTLSFAPPFTLDLKLKTIPKKAGPNLIKVVDLIQNATGTEKVKKIVILILEKMIEERNKGNIPLTKPKNLSIDQVMILLHKHFNCSYQKNAPKLPQIAIYAMYQCLMKSVERYSNFELKPLERLKTANRKSGTVGDIDIWKDGRPIEAVEIKFEISINQLHINEAIQKVRTESVERYFILSTAESNPDSTEEIQSIIADFMRANGCEIIVNGVYGTIKYYLRLLDSTNEFINAYTELLSSDADINYEHKIAWNAKCAEQ